MLQLNSYREKIACMEANLAALKTSEANICEFIARYGGQICGNDGIFGLLSDEILLHILSYLGPRELINPPCTRFRGMTIDVLKILTYSVWNDIPYSIYINMLKYLFKYPICYYYFFYQHILGKNIKYTYAKHPAGTKKFIKQFLPRARKVVKKVPIDIDIYEITYKNHSYMITYTYLFNDKSIYIYYSNNNNIILLIALYENAMHVNSLYTVYITFKKDIYIPGLVDDNIVGLIKHMNHYNSILYDH